MRPRIKHVVHFSLASVAVAVVIGLAIAYIAVSTSLTAERALHANLLVLELVREYALNHQGDWPRTWQDLEQLPAREHAMLRWPADAEDVRRYVAVDFSADPDELAWRRSPWSDSSPSSPSGPATDLIRKWPNCSMPSVESGNLMLNRRQGNLVDGKDLWAPYVRPKLLVSGRGCIGTPARRPFRCPSPD